MLIINQTGTRTRMQTSWHTHEELSHLGWPLALPVRDYLDQVDGGTKTYPKNYRIIIIWAYLGLHKKGMISKH